MTAGGPVPVQPVPEQPAPAPLVPSAMPPGAPPAARRSRMPMWIAIAVGIVSLLCVGGFGIAYHVYDKATRPNRSAPDVTLANYLQAALVDRDESKANDFVCRDQADLTPLTEFRDGFIERTAALQGTSTFMWTISSIGVTGTTATGTAQIVVDTSGPQIQSGESDHSFDFVLIEASGWCVESAAQRS